MKISFIIPVYHVEQYLEQCIQSVLKAWEKEREVILVLGEKTDPSNVICYQYQKEYQEISVLVQNRKGLSNARNCGFKKVTGEYVLFVDSDDYIDSAALKKRLAFLERLLQETDEKVDVLVSDYIAVRDVDFVLRKSQQIKKTAEIQLEKRITEKEDLDREGFRKTRIKKDLRKKVNKKRVRKESANQKGFDKKRIDRKSFAYNRCATEQFLKAHGSIWNVWRYIYRTEFLKQNRIFFLENTANEDVLFTTQVFLKADGMAYFHLPYYYYRVRRNGSLTTQIDRKQVYDFLNIIKNGIKIVRNLKINKNAVYLKEKLQREYLLGLPLVYDLNRKDRKSVMAAYRTCGWIGKDSRQMGYRVLFWWIRVFGVDILAWCFYIIREIRRKSSGIYKKFP